MTRKHLLFVSALLLAATSPSRAQDVKPAEPPATAVPAPAVVELAPWTMVYKKGEAPKFRTYIKADGRNIEDTADIKIRLRSTSSNTVKEVSEAGVAQWDQLDLTRDMVINITAFTLTEAPKPVAVTFAPNGMMTKRVNPGSDPFDPSEKSLALLSSYPAPTVAVKTGDSWKTTVPNPLLKNRQVTFNSTLLGTEKVLGLDTVKVKIQLDFPTAYGDDPGDTAHLDGTYWLDATTHQLVRLSYTVKNSLLPFASKNVVATTYVSRIVAGQNDKEDPEGEKLFAPPAPAKPAEAKG